MFIQLLRILGSYFEPGISHNAMGVFLERRILSKPKLFSDFVADDGVVVRRRSMGSRSSQVEVKISIQRTRPSDQSDSVTKCLPKFHKMTSFSPNFFTPCRIIRNELKRPLELVMRDRYGGRNISDSLRLCPFSTIEHR